VEHDIQVAVSATGDAAVQAATAGLSAASSAPGAVPARFRIEHPALIGADDLRRLADLDVIATISPRALLSLADGGIVMSRLGEERATRAYRYGLMLAGGLRLAGSSDARAFPGRPFEGLYLAITGRAPGGRSIARGATERLERRQAIALYTTGAAHAARREEDAGTIEVGKWADLTVLSSDIMSIPEEEIPGTEVLATFVGGREVYLREPFSEP
jgi:predicted amidohydrolase YtcJ